MSFLDGTPGIANARAGSIRIAGIGSRETPQQAQQQLCDLVYMLVSQHDAILYSGNACGADYACQSGAHYAIQDSAGKLQITSNIVWLPYANFNEGKCPQMRALYVNAEKLPNYADAVTNAKAQHPLGENLKGFALKAHARNQYQIRGYQFENPVDCVLCWTPDGAEHHSEVTKATGGTRTAIALASHEGIPVFNLYNQGAADRLLAFIESIKE